MLLLIDRATGVRRLLAWCVLCVVTLLTTSTIASADVAPQKNWKRLQTPNFELLGNTGDGDLRAVADRLEQFRDAMALLFTSLRPSTNRIRVLVFRNHRAYDPFKPRYEGKPANVGGYFLDGEDVSHITLTVENRDENFGVIYHEYTHLLMADVGSVPVWVSEGLAEYYSSFTTTPDGKQVQMGHPLSRHVLRLRDDFMPLATLVDVARDSAHYNERDKQGVFYAESWALIHYLLLGNEQRYAPQASAFISALAAGSSLEKACLDTLKVTPAQLESELRSYVQRSRFYSQVVKFDERLARLAKLPITPVPDSEVHAALGSLLYRLGRNEEADAQLAVALSLDPESPIAHAALGQLRQRQNRDADARMHLERAALSEAATFTTHFQLARALYDAADAAGTPNDPTLLAAQEAALRKTVALNPSFAEGWHRLGIILASTPDGVTEALDCVQKATQLAPGREQYRLSLAYIYANSQQYAAARALGAALARRATDPDVRDRAQALYDRVDAYMRHLAQAKAAAEAHALPLAESAPGSMRFDEGVRAQGPMIPDLRLPQDGEERHFGYLVSIECQSSGVVIHLDVQGQAMTVRAARFDAIDFISYREDLRGALGCGRRTELDGVVATFRRDAAAAPHAGTAIAVEFVPRGFLPKTLTPQP